MKSTYYFGYYAGAFFSDLSDDFRLNRGICRKVGGGGESVKVRAFFAHVKENLFILYSTYLTDSFLFAATRTL